MGKKDTPPAPDYTGAAREQASASQETANQQTWANRPNQTTPWGSMSWSTNPTTDPATGQRVTQWTQNLELSPMSQEALSGQQRLQAGRTDLAEGLLGRAQEEFGQPMDWNALPEYGSAPQVNAANPNTTRSQFSSGYEIPDAIRNYSRVQGASYSPEDLGSFDTSNLQGVDPSSRYYDAAGDAVYDSFSRRMEPQFRSDQEAMEAKLVNQGFTAGDQGYDRAMQQLSQQQQDARLNAMDRATMLAGQEAQRYHGMDLSTRGQQFGERGTVANYGLNRGSEAFDQRLAGGSQEFSQDLAAGGQQLDAARSLLGANADMADLGFKQDLAEFDQQNTQFGQQLAANQQRFGQETTAANYANTIRQQALAEQMQRRGFSLNEINAILHGQQVNTPNMPNFMGAERGADPQLLAAAGMQYNSSLDAFNAEQAAMQGLLEGIGSFNPFSF